MKTGHSTAKTNLADIARAAGVSPMTVSRVLNGRGGASAETVLRIQQLADEMDYRPNALARGLKSNRSGIVGVVVPDIANPFFPEIIRGIESVATTSGFNLLLCNVIESPDREGDLIRILESQRVDGIILCSARLPDPALAKALSRHKAAVLVNRSIDPAVAGSITIDYRAGAADAVTHLWDLGRRRIGIVGGPLASTGATERLEGINAAFARLGAEPIAMVRCPPTIVGGQEASQTLLDQHPQIDAMICYNDLNAIGAMQLCESRGLAVPQDLALVGFDGIALSELTRPTLSTLHVGKHEIGELSMRMLIDRMENKFVNHSISIRPRLLERQSTVGRAGPKP